LLTEELDKPASNLLWIEEEAEYADKEEDHWKKRKKGIEGYPCSQMHTLLVGKSTYGSLDNNKYAPKESDYPAAPRFHNQTASLLTPAFLKEAATAKGPASI
jgi:hypothetical protein